MYFTVLRAQITDVFVCNQINVHCIRHEPGSGLLPQANQETYLRFQLDRPLVPFPRAAGPFRHAMLTALANLRTAAQFG